MRLRRFLPFFLLMLTLASFLSAREAAVGEISVGGNTISVEYVIPEGFHQTLERDFFYFELVSLESETGRDFGAAARLGEIEYPEGVEEETGIHYYGRATLSAPLVMDSAVPPGSYTGTVRAHYQLCDEAGTCFLPGFTDVSFSFAYDGRTAAAAGPDSGFGSSLAAMLLFALIGGVLLNVMPCVFPILSIRALNLVKQSSNDRRGLRAGALLYGAGVLSSFMVLALAVILLKRSGELVGWGFQFQNPVFVFSLAAILFVFALSLFDLFVFQPPVFGAKLAGLQSRGLLGSFVNGLFAVILATPCTAPFLGSALGFAFSQPPLTIALFFLTIGAGFSLPFVLLGFIPAAVRWIPKPGKWMEIFKEAMGFVLLATAIYFFSIFGRQVDGALLSSSLYFLLILAAVLWLYGKLSTPAAPAGRKWLALVFLAVLPLASGILLFSGGRPSPQGTRSAQIVDSGEGPERIPFGEETMAALEAEGRPVFLVFSAQWCSICKLNDRTVLKTARAAELFEEYGIAMVYGDYTSEDPVIARWISDLGRAGVPVYALYRPGAEKPLLLPELLSFDILEEAFSGLHTAPAPVGKPLGEEIFF